MAAMNNMRKCPRCKSASSNTAKFCTSCGSKFENYCEECGIKKDECQCRKTKTLTLSDYYESKTSQRLHGTKPKRPITNKCHMAMNKNKQSVTINIGIMKPDKFGELKKARGVWAHIKIPPTANEDAVIKEALDQHAQLDQYFCKLDSYLLLYPDLLEVYFADHRQNRLFSCYESCKVHNRSEFEF